LIALGYTALAHGEVYVLHKIYMLSAFQGFHITNCAFLQSDIYYNLYIVAYEKSIHRM